MTLTKYKGKRNLNVSREPAGGIPDTDKLRFVIQKHKASHLHYDFRLEVKGVLKSWAVPKGPSTDPEVKRLALMVEDHPYDYRNFEGTIPSGYGAGTVIVWDEGFYHTAESQLKDKKSQNSELLKGIKAGKLHFVLQGKKLKGEFALVRTKGRGDNAWLLFKVKDKYVSSQDILLKDKSVISKKTIEQIEKTAFVNDKLESKNNPKKKSSVAAKSAKVKIRPSSKDEPNVLSKGRKAHFPTEMEPMLATLIDESFNDSKWQFEIKWDGYRTMAFCNKTKVELKSRNNKSFTERFYPIHKAVKDFGINAVLDGEVVVLDDEGKSQFSALQNWRSDADGKICYYVFDLLWLNGKDLTHISLDERRILLKQIIPASKIIRISENFEVNGIELFESVKKLGFEGIMAKKSDSTYTAGLRSKEWLKIKANKHQEMVIGGYTKNDSTSKAFSSLLLGVFEKKKLIYTGKVGTGFSDKQQLEMLKKFKPYIVKTSPFTETPDINKVSRFRVNSRAVAVWMKPELVCEVNYTEMTEDRIMRHPSFISMRIDKDAADVTKEKAMVTKKIITKSITKSNARVKSNSAKHNQFLNLADDTQIRVVKGHEMKFSNLNKLYWPKEKITKRDLLNYYHEVAAVILPYLKNRPQSMNRHPNGIDGESFYFKDVTGTSPEWIETVKYKSPSDGRVRKYLVAKDEASLLYMASLGCIEMNPFHNKAGSDDYPDWCVIDLDPGENTFNQVIEAAQVTRDILDSLGVTSYPKTSGSTGIHIYIPMAAKYTYDQSKEFARVIATLVQREVPAFTTIERIVKARKGKMYIDFLQNRPQATIAAPYSLRPKAGATVSMPLHWEEVKSGLKMKDFTIYNAMDRIKSEGDIFKPILGKGINLKQVIKKLAV